MAIVGGISSAGGDEAKVGRVELSGVLADGELNVDIDYRNDYPVSFETRQC